MANYAALKATIDANIRANGNEEITGPVLNGVLTNILAVMGQAGYLFKGMAHPGDTPAASDSNLFYLAVEAGQYSGFDGRTVTAGQLVIFAWDGAWASDVLLDISGKANKNGDPAEAFTVFTLTAQSNIVGAAVTGETVGADKVILHNPENNAMTDLVPGGQSEDIEVAMPKKSGTLALQEDVDVIARELDDFANGTNETIYENEGQEEYYLQNGTFFGWRGVATYTPELAAEAKINRIVFPPFGCRYDGPSNVSYYIGYGDMASNIIPNNLTRIADGIVPNVTTTPILGHTVELETPVTVPASKRVWIFLYSKTNEARIRGGGAAATTLAPYNEEDAVVFLYTSSSDSPFSQSWSRASASTTARYKACNPILRLVLQPGVNEKISAIVPDMAADAIAESNQVSIHLPHRLYAVVGDTLQVFFQGIVADIDLKKYDIYVNCAKGKTFTRYYEYTPTVDDIGTAVLTLYVKDRNNNILGTATCELVTVAAPVSPATSKSFFVFGDSLTAEGQWPGEAKRRLVGNNTYDGITGNGLSNIDFFGYMNKEINGQSVDFFAVGGWAWSNYLSKSTAGAFRFHVTGVSSLSIGAKYTNNGYTYTIQEINVTGDSGNIRCTTSANTNTPTASGTLTKSSGDGDSSITFTSYETENANPLWDDVNDKMSFIPYVQDCGANTIDAVYVLLSWNGQAAWKEYSVDDASGHIADAKTFARTLHAEYPSAKLFIMGLQMPSETGGLGYNYGASGGLIDSYGVKQCALNYNKALQDLCESDEFRTYCEFVPVASQFDSHYNMPYYNINVNIRNTTKEMRGSNGVHPLNAGYFQIADAVYRSIVANFCQ